MIGPSVEHEAPELFDIPLLASFYRYPRQKKNVGKVATSSFIRLNRNDPCFCGSGKKVKKCCKEASEEKYQRLIRVIESESLVTDERREYLAKMAEQEARRK